MMINKLDIIKKKTVCKHSVPNEITTSSRHLFLDIMHFLLRYNHTKKTFGVAKNNKWEVIVNNHHDNN